MALERIEFNFKVDDGKTVPVDSFHYGVVGSGDMELLITKDENNAGNVKVTIVTPVKGFDKIWELVLQRFVTENRLANINIDINDNNATPFIVSLRLKQALVEIMEVNE